MIRRLILSAFTLTLCFCGSFAGEHKPTLVIPVEINDEELTSTEEEFLQLFADAERYFEQLEDKYPDSFTLGPAIRLTNGIYTSKTIQNAVAEAYRMCSSMIDMSKYNDDVGFIFSGDSIWPHEDYIQGSTKKYFAISEIFEEQKLSLGLLCHEYCHILGLKDLYDTDDDKSGGQSRGVWGTLSPMDRGDRNNSAKTPSALSSIELQQLELGICDTLQVGHYTLEPLTRSHRYLYLPTDRSGEFFLFECRTRESWDEYISGQGMVVYHIDKSTNKAGFSNYYNTTLTAAQRWEYNQVNCRPDRQCAIVLEAVPDTENAVEVFFPAEDGQVLSSDSTPPLQYWSGQSPELALCNIRMLEDGSVDFDVIRPISRQNMTRLQDAAIIEWKLDPSIVEAAQSCEITLNSADDTPRTGPAEVRGGGIVTYRADGLKSNCRYDVELTVHTKNGDFSNNVSFKTMVADERNTLPFIYLHGLKKTANGFYERGSSFPLYVYNGYRAQSIRWIWNGIEIEDTDRFFTLKESGILRAELEYEDGTTDVIVKEFILR